MKDGLTRLMVVMLAPSSCPSPPPAQATSCTATVYSTSGEIAGGRNGCIRARLEVKR